MGEDHLWRLVRRRRIKFIQDGPRSPIKFRPEWIDEYIDEHTHEPQTAKPERRGRKLRTGVVADTEKYGFGKFANIGGAQ